MLISCFFFNDTATTEIYTLSLHDALPISGDDDLRPVASYGVRDRCPERQAVLDRPVGKAQELDLGHPDDPRRVRSEEHTSELQSRQYLVCRLLLEKKKKSH